MVDNLCLLTHVLSRVGFAFNWFERKNCAVILLTRLTLHIYKTQTFVSTFILWCYGKKVVFVFFAHKTYSRIFIKLRLNRWCHMDYFNNVLIAFLGLERCSSTAVYILDFIQNNLICVLKMNGFMGFWTTWGWVINDRFSFLSDSFSSRCIFMDFFSVDKLCSFLAFCY